LYSKCKNFIQNEQTQQVCRFENFLCLDGDTEPCFYINTTIWSIFSQEVKSEYRTKLYKPILKTCPSRRKRKSKTYCKTDKCDNDSDCLSGKCSNNICLFDESEDGKVIYFCSGEEEKEFMRCGKNGGMMVNDSDECYSGMSSYHFCTSAVLISNGKILKIVLIIFGIYGAIIIIGVIGVSIAYYIKKNKKNKKKEVKNEVMSEFKKEVIEIESDKN